MKIRAKDIILIIISVLIALSCLTQIRSGAVASYIYAIGLIVSAIGRIAQAFRKTAIVHIA